MNNLEFSALKVGDRVAFTVLRTDMYGEGSVVEILPWSVYPAEIEWMDVNGNWHIEKFNLDCFEAIEQIL